jgi:hypothetical protein
MTGISTGAGLTDSVTSAVTLAASTVSSTEFEHPLKITDAEMASAMAAVLVFVYSPLS